MPSKLKYNHAAPTFHQFRGNRQVYGLNFENKEDSDKFAKAMQSALDTLQRKFKTNWCIVKNLDRKS